MRGLVLRALYLLPALVMRVLGWRLLRLTNPQRVGHLAGEPDCVLKEEALGLSPKRRTLLLAPRGGVGNEHLVTYWSRRFPTVRSPLACKLMGPLNRFGFLRVRDDLTRYFVAIGATSEAMRVHREWGERPPLLELSAEDIARGEARLSELGVPPGAQFVCFHSRGPGYSPQDEHLHDYRNSAVETYLGAATVLVARGVYAVRMGDPSMPRLPAVEGIIDYAHSPLRADWMDVFLCARCRFFLGNSSGLSFLAGIFGRPSALANLVPFSGALPYGPRDIGIPKLLRRDGRLLTFKEILETEVGDLRFSRLYAERRIEVVENSADEIRDLALEMLDGGPYSEEDRRRQERFRALLRPGHFSHGSAGRVGRDFLRKYEHLFGDRPS